jgi:transposase
MTSSSSTVQTSSQASGIFVGIDVAKDKLDLARSDTKQLLNFANDEKGIEQLLGSLAGVDVACIVVEATGGLERPLVDALLNDGQPVALVNPQRARQFAIGCGVLAKTDRIDATVLMDLAQRGKLQLARKRSENQAELDALVTCRRQLIRTRTDQGNCRSSTTSKHALKSIDSVLRTLDQQIDVLDQKIRKLIDSDDDFKHMDRLLQTVPGVGPVLSSTMAAELSELGSTDRQRISALVGVAPFNQDSGRFKGKRSIRGGRSSVRNTLYMATVAAMRFNPLIRNFADRLRRAGKLEKVIIVACMRKLLTFLNAMIRDNLEWNQLRIVRSTLIGGGAK